MYIHRLVEAGVGTLLACYAPTDLKFSILLAIVCVRQRKHHLSQIGQYWQHGVSHQHLILIQ